MRSVKPGRGPSAIGAVLSLACVVFGIGWTIAVYNMADDAAFPFGFMFPLFGVVFVVVGLVQAYYHFNNATARNRFSAFDITSGKDEPDPLNQTFGAGAPCPHCGAIVQQDFDYCPKCGKKI